MNFSNPYLFLSRNRRGGTPIGAAGLEGIAADGRHLCRAQFHEGANQLEGEQHLKRKKNRDTGDERNSYRRSFQTQLVCRVVSHRLVKEGLAGGVQHYAAETQPEIDRKSVV